MRKAYEYILSLIIAFGGSNSIDAKTIFVNGVYYEIVKEATSTAFGEVAVAEPAYGQKYSGDFIIPQSIINNGEYSVTAIGLRAFDGSNVTSVTIPNTIRTIGVRAFAGCNITSLTIPKSVTTIEMSAFQACKNLVSVVLPSSITDIPTGAFWDCAKLEHITIPNSVKSIGADAFTNCILLESVEIPNSVKYIGGTAFSGCSKLEKLFIPSSVDSIGMGITDRCISLKSIVVDSNNLRYDSRNNCSAIIHTATNALIAGCQGSVIPDDVVSISKWAFRGCISLKDLTFPDRIVNIGASAFYGCSSLSYITIPNGVTSIGDYAFSGCTGLNNIILKCPTPPVITSSVFSNIDKEKVLLSVPNGCSQEYQSADVWKEFLGIEEYLLKCQISFVVDGCIFYQDSIVYGGKIELKDIPFKEGYTFSGWSEVPKTMPAEDVTISGTFTVNKYLVTFKIGDEVIATDSLEYGAAIVAPDAPEKEGHTFDGWGDVADSVPASDLMYEGSYSVNTYLLTYTVDGEAAQTDSVAYGTAITLLDEPTKEGYTFSGWSVAPETMPAEDVTISGTFTVNKYLVTFKIGEEVIAADSLEYGAAIIAPEAHEREGHTFNGWGEVAETVPANDVTIEGSYSVNSYLLTYTVDGEIVQADSVAYGTAITLLDEPTKEGYTFSGWSEAPETMPAEDVTINGTFAINKYLVTFKIGDEVIAADSLEYGAAIVAPEAPEKEGHTFNGWGEVAETVPANDLTYEGTYTANIYKVYYYVGEELVHTIEVAYGEAIPEYIYEPTDEGDVFEGWIGETYETMPAHDVSYTANITNGIAHSTLNPQRSTIYDLSGRKVLNTENLRGGVYIVNGKKVVIK